MSTPAHPLIQMYAPDGTLGDIPYEQMHAALQAGGKLAVHMTAPDGTAGFVPADRVPDAVKSGGKIIPFDLSQKQNQPGFFGELGSGLKGIAQGVAGGGIPTPGQIVNQSANAAINEAQRQQEGRSLPYRATAMGLSALGVNPEPMEEAGRRGDVSGVYGAATAQAAPVVAGAAGSEISRHGAGPIAEHLDSVRDAMGRALRDPVTNKLKTNVKAVSSIMKLVGGPEIAEAIVPDHPEAVAQQNIKKTVVPKNYGPEVPEELQPGAQQAALKSTVVPKNYGPQVPAELKPGANLRALQSTVVPANYGPEVPAELQPGAQQAALKSTVVPKNYGPQIPPEMKNRPRVSSPSAAPTGEGRPATWTNDTVRTLASWGDPDALQQARLRGFTDIKPKYSTAEVTPRSVTKFDAEGKPIGDTSSADLPTLIKNKVDAASHVGQLGNVINPREGYVYRSITGPDFQEAIKSKTLNPGQARDTGGTVNFSKEPIPLYGASPKGGMVVELPESELINPRFYEGSKDLYAASEPGIPLNKASRAWGIRLESGKGWKIADISNEIRGKQSGEELPSWLKYVAAD